MGAALALLTLFGACGCRTTDSEPIPSPVTPVPVPSAEAPVIPVPRMDDAERVLARESFEKVWVTIRDKHWDPALFGLDWMAVREEHLPKLEQAATHEEVTSVLNSMLSRLGHSHVGVIPASRYQVLEGVEKATAPAETPEVAGGAATMPALGGPGVPGIEFRIVEGAVLVTRVTSAQAAALGVRPGAELLRAGENDVQALLEAGRADEKGDYLPHQLQQALAAIFEGRVGEQARLLLRDLDDTQLEVLVPLIDKPGVPSQFGNLPEMHVHFESRRIGADVGYVALNIFLDPMRVLPAFEGAIGEFHAARGLVIDLRGNPGGIGFMAMAMAGWLIEGEGQELGTMKLRDTELKFVINPREGAYAGPVAVLVDELSASTSEIFAAGLQDLGRARVFGVRTAGAALPSIIEVLPNGDGFQYPIADYISQGGMALEKHGVTPDSIVPITRASLARGADAALEAALEWIRSAKG